MYNCWQAMPSICMSAGQVNWEVRMACIAAWWSKRQTGVQQAHLTKRAAE